MKHHSVIKIIVTLSYYTLSLVNSSFHQAIDKQIQQERPSKAIRHLYAIVIARRVYNQICTPDLRDRRLDLCEEPAAY